MNAKSKANFINSIASGEKTPCPNCGALNEAKSDFCSSCGKRFDDKGLGSSSDSATKSSAAFKKVSVDIVDTDSEDSVFAKGLPSWDVVPPQIMVRRNRRR